MHLQPFIDSSDPLKRLVTLEAVRPPDAPEQSAGGRSRLARIAGLAAALVSIPAGGVIAFRASEAERQALEVCAPLSGASGRRVYASTPAPSTGPARARERLREQLSQQAALYAATPAPPETRQQRRARERQRI